MAFPSFDNYANFAATTVATAPSPATSGTSLIVASGTGALFATPPFDAVAWPSGSQPTGTNAEIVRVTAIATDTLTITRAQESTSAQSIAIGYNIAANITLKALTDLMGAVHLGNSAASNVTTSSATTTPVTVLTFSAVNSATYQIQFIGQLASANTTTGALFNITGPTGATGVYNLQGAIATTTTLTTSAAQYAVASLTWSPVALGRSTSITPVTLEGRVVTLTTSGTVSILAAAATAGGTQTISGASLTAFRVA